MTPMLHRSLVALALAAIAAGASARAQSPATSPVSGSEPPFKVRLDFNRWHDTDEIKADLQRLQKAWPKFLKYSSIGRSHAGKDIMLMTINNPDTRVPSAFEFGSHIGVGFSLAKNHAVGLALQHLSNAGLKQPNGGIDLVLIQYTFTHRD